MVKKYEFIDFIKLEEINTLSVKEYFFSGNINNKNYALFKIHELLQEKKTKINLDNETKYKQVTVSLNHKGVKLRTENFGKDIKTKGQYKIDKGNFLISLIDIKDGACGIISKKLDKAIITNSFREFQNKRNDILDISFFDFLISSSFYREKLFTLSSGTTGRKPVKVHDFLNIEVSFPDISTQQKILKNYNNKINLAKQQEQQAKQKEQEIEDYLYRELGVTKIEKEDKKEELLQFVNLKDLDRWDVEYLKDKNNIDSNFKVIFLKNIINKFLKDEENNSLRFNSKQKPEKEFKYIGMENIQKETGQLLKLQNVKGKDIKSQTIKLPQNYFLYGKLRPYLNKYFFNKKNLNFIVSSEFFVFSIKNINRLYFEYYLGSSIIQYQIKNYMKGSRMPRISEELFKNLKIPLPPLEIQNRIAEHIGNLKKEIEILKQSAEKNRKLAIEEFEGEVFGV